MLPAKQYRAFGKLPWIALFLVSSPLVLQAQKIAIGEYPAPTPGSKPNAIAASPAPDSALWFTERDANKIARMTTYGAATEYSVPTAASSPYGIALGPDNAMWFTELGAGQIGRIDISSKARNEYPTPTAGSSPVEIALGPDGAMWFTELSANQIGRIDTTTKAITEYPIPTPNSAPYGIAKGPDGAMWFTESGANQIGRIDTTTFVITEYPIPTANSDPNGITAGQDGALWFAESASTANNIGRITTAGGFTEYSVPTASSYPVEITMGPDGALWFTERDGNKIARISPFAGAITEYSVPTANSFPVGITTGPDGELWFAEYDGDKLGEAVFVSAGLRVSPARAAYRATLTFTGSKFASGETVILYNGGIGSPVLTTATADSTGSFTVTALAPPSVYGHRLFLGVGQTSNKVGAATFFATARLIMNPNAGSVGSTSLAQGYGFGAGEQVDIYWDNPSTFLGTVTATRTGAFTGAAALNFTIPAGSPTGAHSVSGTGRITGAIGKGSFNVQ